MAKRFRDTNVWRKRWIRELSPKMKLFWFYLLDNCDHAGVWDVDVKRADFDIGGTKYDEQEILKTFHRKIVPFKKDKWFIPKFIDYQYGELNENVNAHKSVIKILERYGLNDELSVEELLSNSSSGTVQDKDKDKEIKQRQRQYKDKPKNLNMVVDYFKEINIVSPNSNAERFFNYYETNGWVQGAGKKPIKSWKACVKTWKFEKDEQEVVQLEKICPVYHHEKGHEKKMVESKKIVKCKKCLSQMISISEWEIYKSQEVSL